MKICFLDKTDFKYSFKDKYSPKLRGAETTLINLSYNLKLLGCSIYIFNNCSNEYNENNYYWTDLSNIKSNKIIFDIAISNGDINLLDNIISKKKYAISYSLQNLEKFIRKKQVKAFIKNKPKIVFIGKYHSSKRPLLTRIFGHKYLILAVDDIFNNTKIDNKIDNYKAIFTSRPDRNLKILLDIWSSKIHSRNTKYKLYATPSKEILNYKSNNIFPRNMVDQKDYLNNIKNSRLMLIPGHKAELFCLAAEEARELCIPIVTMGIGSLKERVEHNVTGLIARDKNEFADYAIKLFENDELWNKIRTNLLKKRGISNWQSSAKKFLEEIKS